MTKKSWDLCGQTTTIDLMALRQVLLASVKNAKAELDKYTGTVDTALKDSFYANSSEESYHQLHDAKFYAEYVEQAAIEYHEAVKALHYITEAIKRNEIKFVGQGELKFGKK